MNEDSLPPDLRQKKQPIFDPKAFDAAPVIALAVAMIAIHGWIEFSGLGERNPLYGKMWFAPRNFWAGERLEQLLSYAFLHVNWVHVLLNTFLIYLLGSRCWRRMGTVRFLTFFVLTSVAGAVAFAIGRPDGISPLAGASAVVYGLLAATFRYRFRVQSLRGKDMRLAVIAFIGIVLGFELMSGLTSVDVLSGAMGRPAAWEAHLGGFFVGWLIAPWLVKFWPT